MDKYKYDPLDEERFEVRILILLPGSEDDPVQALLYTRTLTKDEYPLYEAVSYAWGSLEDPISIAVRTANISDINRLFGEENSIVDQKTFTQELQPLSNLITGYTTQTHTFGQLLVTQNLGRALPYLRLPGKARALWIDAMCVNQQDLPERSLQVQRMADIYRLASKVVVWLGEQSHDSDLAIDTLKVVQSNAYFDFERQVLVPADPDNSDPHWADRNEPMRLGLAEAVSIVDFCSRPWFHRLWVRQEIYLGSSASLVMCGNRKMRWRDLRSSLAVVFSKGPGHLPISGGALERLNASYSKVCQAIMDLCAGGNVRHFMHLIIVTASTQCTDPRDRVYALLSLTRREELKITPDYTQNPYEVYREMMRNLLISQSSLRYLALCEFVSPLKIPSWVPDLSRTKTSFELKMYKSRVLVEPPVIDGDILYARGVQIATVQKVHKSLLLTGSNTDSRWGELCRLIQIVKPVCTGARLENLVRTLVENDFAENHQPPLMSHQPISTIGRFSALLTADPTSLFDTQYQWLKPYLHDFSGTIQERSFFVDTKGNFGLCSLTSEPGDLVVYLLSCGTPFILRPRDDGTYLVIGEAYHHGSMSEEPILGPIPSPYRRVWDQLSYTVFLNEETGMTQVEDPRLGDLPPGFSRVAHADDNHYFIFLEESTGNTCYSDEYDPRIMIEAEKRGVQWQEFRLS